MKQRKTLLAMTFLVASTKQGLGKGGELSKAPHDLCDIATQANHPTDLTAWHPRVLSLPPHWQALPGDPQPLRNLGGRPGGCIQGIRTAEGPWQHHCSHHHKHHEYSANRSFSTAAYFPEQVNPLVSFAQGCSTANMLPSGTQSHQTGSGPFPLAQLRSREELQLAGFQMVAAGPAPAPRQDLLNRTRGILRASLT